MGVKEDIVTLLTGASGIDDTAITRDDDTLEASYSVIVANPPHVQAKDWLLTGGKAKDAVVTVSDLRAENRRITGTVPLVEDGRYLVKTWTVAKSDANDTVVVDGIKLKQKLDDEVKGVFRDSPTDRYVVGWENNDRLVNGTWVYCTTFTIAYMVAITA